MAVLRGAGKRPEVREELIRVVRNGRMTWRCFGEGGENWVKGTGGSTVRHH